MLRHTCLGQHLHSSSRQDQPQVLPHMQQKSRQRARRGHSQQASSSSEECHETGVQPALPV